MMKVVRFLDVVAQAILLLVSVIFIICSILPIPNNTGYILGVGMTCLFLGPLQLASALIRAAFVNQKSKVIASHTGNYFIALGIMLVYIVLGFRLIPDKEGLNFYMILIPSVALGIYFFFNVVVKWEEEEEEETPNIPHNLIF